MASSLFDALIEALRPFLSAIVARSVVEMALKRHGLDRRSLDRLGLSPALVKSLDRSVAIYLRDREQRQECARAVKELVERPLPGRVPEPAARSERLRVESERDIVVARSRARNLAAEFGFDSTEQIKIVTAVSEVTRNIYAYAGEGEVTMRPLNAGQRGIEIIARDRGPGIADLDRVMSDDYTSRTGMGLGLKGCRRLMSSFEVDSAPGRGTTVTMRKLL